MKSCEERVEDIVKEQLRELGLHYYTKTESINSEIDYALEKYPSKRGGDGKNYPDIKMFIQDDKLRKIPVMIEIKGSKGKLERIKDGRVENQDKSGNPYYANIKNYAVNGAVHYASAILDYAQSYNEVIAIGINGYFADKSSKDLTLEYGFYYLNRKNLSQAKNIGVFDDLSCLSSQYLEDFLAQIDTLSLTPLERERAIEDLEFDIENKLNRLNQFLHDELLNVSPNTRVTLLVGMIMAAHGVKDRVAPLKVEDLKGEQGDSSNDGQTFMRKIKDFLIERKLPSEKINLLINELEKAFVHSGLWKPTSYANALLQDQKDETPLKKTYSIVLDDILPLVKKLQTADVAGRLFNSITKWLEVPDNEKNDVVLTPRYVVNLMVALAKVNKDSYVWDYATGSGAFLISAMNAMIKDSESIASPKEREKKIAHIKTYQLLGIEKRLDIYLLGILNMILLDDGSANLLHKSSLEFDGQYEQGEKKGEKFPADVFLLNPPYSAQGKGFIFVDRALRVMSRGML